MVWNGVGGTAMKRMTVGELKRYPAEVTPATLPAGSAEMGLSGLDPLQTSAAYDSSQHHWIAALQGRVPLLPTAEIALRTMLIQEGIYMSQARGEEVRAEEVKAQSVATAQPG